MPTITACINTNRILGFDPYAEYVLELVNHYHTSIPNKTFPNVQVYFPPNFTGRMDKDLVYDIRRGATKLDQKDLAVNPSKYVLLFRPKLLRDLNMYIANTEVGLTTSVWPQYWEQDKPEIKRLKAWLAANQYYNCTDHHEKQTLRERIIIITLADSNSK